MRTKLLGGVVLLLLALAPCRAAETLYAGKPLAFWLEELKSGDGLICEEAIAILADAGPAVRESVPHLEALLKDKRSGVRRRAALALWRIAGQSKPAVEALTERLRDRTSPPNPELLNQLGQFGSAAASSAPAVMEFIDDRDVAVRSQAMMTMQRFGAAAVPVLVPLLQDKDTRVRRTACRALGLLGANGRDAVPKLTLLLKDADTEIRLAALATLGRIGMQAREATPAIIRLAREKDIPLRAASLQALQEMSADPRLVRPLAVEALEDENVLIRCRAVCLLWRVAPKHPDILPHLLELLQQSVGRGELLGVLTVMGSAGARAVPVLTKLLAEVDTMQRRQVIQALGRIGPAARSAVPALLEQLQTSDIPSRQDAVTALRNIRGDSERVVPAILAAAKRDMTTRSMCLPLLGDYGARAAAAAPWLVEEMRRQPSYVTVQMAETLYKIDPPRARKDAVPVLRGMLKPSGPWRVYAAMALRQIEPNSEEGLRTLIDCINGPDVNARQQACQFLGTLGRSARAAVPALRRALRDTRPNNRLAAAVALWKISGETEASVPVLLDMLKPAPDHYTYMRYQSAQHLGEMGPRVKETALPALRKYRDDPDPAVRSGVLQAIPRIEGAEPRP